MRTLKTAVLAALVAATGAAAAGIGIQAELGVLNITDVALSTGADMAQTKVGLRLGYGPVAYDCLLGFGMRSEIADPSMNPYSWSPKYFNVGAIIGFAAKIHNGERTALSFLGRYGLSIMQDGDMFENSSYEYEFDYYSMIVNSVFAGFEPSFRIGDNMEIFSNFGISVQITPDSKYLVQPGGPGMPTEWVDVPDGSTSVALCGILLGFRYNL